MRHKRNLPAAAFVLAFQEAEEQCESFLISLWTNEIVLQARSGCDPTAQVVRKGGKASLIKAQQNRLKNGIFLSTDAFLKNPCKCWHIHGLSNSAYAYANEQEALFWLWIAEFLACEFGSPKPSPWPWSAFEQAQPVLDVQS